MAKPLVADELWEFLQPLLPPPKPRRFRYPGRKPIDDRQVLTGILFILKTGLPWEDLPVEMGCGCGMTCWRRLAAWHQAGVWVRLAQVLLAHLAEADTIDWSRAAIDSSFARAFGGREVARIPRIGGVPASNTMPSWTPRASRWPVTSPLPMSLRSRNCSRWWTVPGRWTKPRGSPSTTPKTSTPTARMIPNRSARRYARDVEPHLAKRSTSHGSGLGTYRWVVERFFSWLHGFRKLRFVTAKTQEMQLAFFHLALALICLRGCGLSGALVTRPFSAFSGWASRRVALGCSVVC